MTSTATSPRRLAARAGSLEQALARKTLARVGDYLANLLCRRLLPAEELQAYVRTNVRHHFGERLGVVSELARYAYEVHYLRLAGLPRASTSSGRHASRSTSSPPES